MWFILILYNSFISIQNLRKASQYNEGRLNMFAPAEYSLIYIKLYFSFIFLQMYAYILFCNLFSLSPHYIILTDVESRWVELAFQEIFRFFLRKRHLIELYISRRFMILILYNLFIKARSHVYSVNELNITKITYSKLFDFDEVIVECLYKKVATYR